MKCYKKLFEEIPKLKDYRDDKEKGSKYVKEIDAEDYWYNDKELNNLIDTSYFKQLKKYAKGLKNLTFDLPLGKIFKLEKEDIKDLLKEAVKDDSEDNTKEKLQEILDRYNPYL